MIVAVFDTNVLASGVLGLTRPDSTPGELLRRWRTKSFHLAVSDHILAELTRTLTNSYFASRLSRQEIDAALVELRAAAVIQSITVQVSGVATHLEDDLIVAVALSAGASHLVTGDKRLHQLGEYQGTRLLSPRQFLAHLEHEADLDRR